MADRTGMTIYLDTDLKTEIEDEFLKRKQKNFNEGYRQLISLGFTVFKNEKNQSKEVE